MEANLNDDYVASLNERGRQEYKVAMYGEDWAAYDLATYETVLAPEVGGCVGAAWEAHPDPGSTLLSESPVTTYEGLIDQLRVQADPDPVVLGESEVSGFLGAGQIDALNAEWLECFTGEYGEVVIPDPTALIKASPEGVWDISLPLPVRNPRGAWVLAKLVGPDGEFWLKEGRVPDEYRSLAGRPAEIAVAVADFKCRQRTDYVVRFLDIVREAQERFVTANQPQMSEMAAAIEQHLAQ
jgi:hypothetical protein